jgi:hypothetical protein
MSQASADLNAASTPMSATAWQRLPAPLPNPEVFEIMEFCAWARVSRTIAFREIAAGRLRALRVGRKSLITIDNARAWLNSLPTMRSA